MKISSNAGDVRVDFETTDIGSIQYVDDNAENNNSGVCVYLDDDEFRKIRSFRKRAIAESERGYIHGISLHFDLNTLISSIIRMNSFDNGACSDGPLLDRWAAQLRRLAERLDGTPRKAARPNETAIVASVK